MTGASPGVTVGVPDVGSWLLGTWRLRRTVRTVDGHELGRFVGELTVTRTGPATATSRERGVLLREGARFEAARTLRYDLHDDGTATVRFDHGGRFHDLDLRTGRDDVVHPCGDDTYRGHTEVVDVDRFVQVWQVTGPTEDYTSTTHAARTSHADRSTLTEVR